MEDEDVIVDFQMIVIFLALQLPVTGNIDIEVSALCTLVVDNIVQTSFQRSGTRCLSRLPLRS